MPSFNVSSTWFSGSENIYGCYYVKLSDETVSIVEEVYFLHF